MSSIPNGQKDEWSSASQELFSAARSDHAPTSADRERVRRALAQRIAIGQGASSAGGLAGHAGGALSRVLKVGFGVSLVVVATIAVKRVQEPSRVAQTSVVQPAAATAAPSEPVRLAAQPRSNAVAVRENAAQAAGADSAAQGRSHALLRGDAPQARDAASQLRDDASSARTARRAHTRAALAPAATQSQPARAHDPEPANDHAATTAQQQPATRIQGDAENQAERAHGQQQVSKTAAEDPAAPRPAAAREQRSEQAEQRVSDARTPRTSKVEEAEDSQAADARAELVFVRRMQTALRAGESEDVLELSQEHALRWPHGTFVQEREGLRAIASCNTAAQSADARAKAFLTKYPRTPLGPRVRDACKLQLKAASAAAAVSGEAKKAER